MTKMFLLFGLPMLLAGAMIDPKAINIGGLISYWAIMAVILPFVGWPLFLTQIVVPTAGRIRFAAVVNLWLGGTTLAVLVIYWLYAVLSYDSSGARVDWSHRILCAPKTGIAIGLFCLCMLVSCGCWGAIAPILRPQVAAYGALVSGVLLFGIVYSAGWWLVLT